MATTPRTGSSAATRRASTRRASTHAKTAAALLASALAAATPLGCMSRMGNAEVRHVRGAPCFTLDEDETSDEGFWLHAMTVYDTTTGPPTSVWSIVSQAQSLRVPASACIPYGDVPPGYSSEPPAPLQRGRVYTVSVNASTDGRNRRSQAHSTKFCVLPQPDGSVRPIPLDPESRAWREEFCPPHAR